MSPPHPSAAVLDASGAVVAQTGEGPWVASPSDVSVPLPGGGRLVVRPRDEAGWQQLARAFVHEVRSPLNALAIYLDLLEHKLAPPVPGERAESAGRRLLEKSEQQVRRVDELLQAFSVVWAPREDEDTDVAAIGRAVARFAEHEAKRLSAQFTARVCATACCAGSAGEVTAAICVATMAAFASAEGGVVELEVGREGPAVGVRLGVAPAPGRAAWASAAAAFAVAGARVEVDDGSVRALFAGAPPRRSDGDRATPDGPAGRVRGS